MDGTSAAEPSVKDSQILTPEEGTCPTALPQSSNQEAPSAITARDTAKETPQPVPQGPGLGVEINWDWIEANRTGLVTYE